MIMAALWNRTGQYIFILWFLSSIFYLFSSPNLSGRTFDVYHRMMWSYSANLECRSEMYWKRLAENTGPQSWRKIAIWAPSHNFVGPCLRN